MHSHSGALQPRAMPANVSHPQGQQQHVVSINAPANFRPNPKVEYSAQNVPVVKWLTITQLVLACIIFVLHAATTAMNDHFNAVAAPIEDQLNYLYWSFSDEAATGVWVGIVMIVAAVIGIQAYKTQRKGLIITHLVFNIFLMMFCCTLIGTISATIAQLNNCRHFGEYYESLNSGAYYTTTGKPLYLFGEQLTPPHGNFYCSHVMFTVWLAFDSIILACAVLSFILTMTLFVYNCIAACTCCYSCCGSCCGCCDDATEYSRMPASNYAQPAGQPMMPHTAMSGQPAGQPMMPHTVMSGQPAGQPVMPHTGMSAQPAGQPMMPHTAMSAQPAGQPMMPHTGMSGQLPPYSQHGTVPMYPQYGAPVVMPGSNQYAVAVQPGDVSVHEASHLSGTTAATSQIGLPPAGGIANPENKSGDLPPEYTETNS